MTRQSAKARVQVTIEVDIDQPWAPDCTVAQVVKQARESAADKVHKALSAPGVRVERIGHVHVWLEESP